MVNKRNTARKSTGGTSTAYKLNTEELVPSRPPSPSPEPVLAHEPTQPSQGSTPARVLAKILQRAGNEGGAIPPFPDSYCSLCGDGGDLLVECQCCRRSNCAACIPGLAEVDGALLETLRYYCPACHGRRQPFFGLWKGEDALFPNGMEIAASAVGPHGARFNSSPLVIIEFILDSLPKLGSPAQVLYTYLQSNFVSNPHEIKHIQCAFNIDPDDLKAHSRKLQSIMTALKRGGFERVVLVVQTHSDKDRGDLFYCGDGSAETSRSTDVSNFFDGVIGPTILGYISKCSYSLMVMAACGSVVTKPDAIAGLRGVIEKFRFSDSFAFSEPGLHPFRLVSFINEFAMNVLITGHPSAVTLPTILSSTSTTQFTGVVHFKPTDSGVVAERFERVHPTLRPNGKLLPQQCPKCRSYRSWVVPSKRPKKHNKSLSFKCCKKGCLYVFEVKGLEGFRRLPKDYTKFVSKVIDL